MPKDTVDKNKSKPANRIGNLLKDLLDRLSKETQELAGILNPQPRPALQPIPVRRPVSPRTRNPIK